jgi:ribosomal protein S18 acetylase RimI-like enzyme
VHIRPRTPADGPALAAIAAETHRLDGYPKYLPADLEAFIVDPGALAAWVAEDAGVPVGHVALHRHAAAEVMEVARRATGSRTEDALAVVARLLVAPAARRRGLARALLDEATGAAAGMGRRAVLDVVDEHAAAIALYERAGWLRAGRVRWELPDGRPLEGFVYLSPG